MTKDGSRCSGTFRIEITVCPMDSAEIPQPAPHRCLG